MSERVHSPSSWELAFEHLLGVLIHPSKIWGSLARTPTFGLALLFSVLLSAAAAYFQAAKVDPEEVMERILRENPAAAESIQLEAIERGLRFSTLLGALFFGPLVYVVSAAVFRWAVHFAGGEVPYRHALALTVHGLLPLALGSLWVLMVLPFHEVVPARALQESLLVPTHLGVLLSADQPGWLRALAGSADLLSLWSLRLLAHGFSAVGQLPLRAAWLGIGGTWLGGVFVKTVLALMSS
jgi:hypothetical protein